jgi:predicted 3-demethylubiquinone-9 3-methyltransferase (glyoxalase superfamily)
MSKKIKPCLWMDDRIEEAVNFYVSVFKDGKILDTSRFPDSVPGMGGKVMVMNFVIHGQEFMALAGRPDFTFNDSVSFYVACKDQAEVDQYWNALTANGGAESMCGWLKDKYGLSWQIVPDRLGELLSQPDKAKAGRAAQAMMQMRKIDIAALERAAE